MRSVLLVLVLGCSFETGAVRDYLGHTCGMVEQDSMTVATTSPCWADKTTSGACFTSAEDPCVKDRRRVFVAGEHVTIWCPLERHEFERHRLVPVQCEWK
jgi:hypothetical protein